MERRPKNHIFFVPLWTTSSSADGALTFKERFSCLASVWSITCTPFGYSLTTIKVSTEFIEFSDGMVWLLMDEAQDSYWDEALWNWFKNFAPLGGVRVILFCSYGSPSRLQNVPTLGTPIEISRHCRMGLWPTEEFSVGLHFTQAEMSEYVWRHPEFTIDEDLELFFLWTGGHIGAIVALCRVLELAVSLSIIRSTVVIIDNYLTAEPNN